MTAFFIAQCIGLSLSCSLLLLSVKPRIKYGANTAYLCWWLVPLQLVAGYLVLVWPTWFAASDTSVIAGKISYYSVQAIPSQYHDFSVLWGILVLIWALGVALYMTFALMQWWQVKSLVNKGERIVIDSCPLATYLVDTDSAMLAGIVNPVILLPKTFLQLSHFQQQSILEHELVHWRRHDISVNLFAWSLLSLCWFNPIFHFAYRRFRQEQELACDAHVCRHLTKDQRIAYGRLLLAQAQSRPLAMLATQSGNKHTLKERIMQLKHHNIAGKSVIMALVLVSLMGAIALISSQQLIAGEGKHGTHPYPVVRIEPVYPTKAVEQKLEGYVQLKFDITPAGKVTNIDVLKSLPIGVFDQSAEDALAQWQYQASSQGAIGSLVQLDYRLAPAEDVERIAVTAK